MTANDRAGEVISWLSDDEDAARILRRRIALEIDAAIQEERAAIVKLCEKRIAEDCNCPSCTECKIIAEKIRERT